MDDDSDVEARSDDDIRALRDRISELEAEAEERRDRSAILRDAVKESSVAWLALNAIGIGFLFMIVGQLVTGGHVFPWGGEGITTSEVVAGVVFWQVLFFAVISLIVYFKVKRDYRVNKLLGRRRRPW